MSTLSSMLRDCLALLYPAHCVACGKLLEGRVEWICIPCRADIPLTHFHIDPANPMTSRLKDIFPQVESATAMFYYINKGKWRNVIHEMKYNNSWLSAVKMGIWYGSDLKESPIYQDIDVVIPVPLHFSRLLKRRYNQAEKIAEGISKAMGIKLCRHTLRRIRNNPSQVTQTKDQRWSNVQGLFAARNTKQLRGKHILLVDDVFTTGATISACIEALIKAIPDCRISVATLAVSRNEILGTMI
ncbi:MAG: phosphoribosyltransferase family protein [Rikenellaceae bacterium]